MTTRNMTISRRNWIIALHGTTLNAVSQALKYVHGLTRDRLFSTLCIPHTMTTHNRYWSNSYNITPWEDRSRRDKFRADIAAIHLLLATNPRSVNFVIGEVTAATTRR